jgi:hypothetical protein
MRFALCEQNAHQFAERVLTLSMIRCYLMPRSAAVWVRYPDKATKSEF